MTLTTTKRAIVSTNDLEEIRELQSRIAEKLKSVGQHKLAALADDMALRIESVSVETWESRDARFIDCGRTVQ